MTDSSLRLIKLRVESRRLSAGFFGLWQKPIGPNLQWKKPDRSSPPKLAGLAYDPLNDEGRKHGLRFEYVEKDYDYLLQIARGHIRNTLSWAAGPKMFTTVSVEAFDARGNSVFKFSSNEYSGADVVKRFRKLLRAA